MLELKYYSVHKIENLKDFFLVSCVIIDDIYHKIYGAHLSLHNEVYMVDKSTELIEKINVDGLIIVENGKNVTYHPSAVASVEEIGIVDLVVVFVKSLFSKTALEENRSAIGEHTYVLTLQNGAGHEELLSEFVPNERIILGTTEDNGVVLDLAYVQRGGVGKINFGMLCSDTNNMLTKCKEHFDSCGFECYIFDNIQQLIWDKLFTNISLSVVTRVLQVPIGYIASNEYAWSMTKQLINEAIQVTDAMGLKFDEEEIIKRVRQTSINSPEGVTSIYMDLNRGRKTEVNTISGSVVRAAAKLGVAVPTHEFVVNMLHAMEDKK